MKTQAPNILGKSSSGGRSIAGHTWNYLECPLYMDVLSSWPHEGEGSLIARGPGLTSRAIHYVKSGLYQIELQFHLSLNDVSQKHPKVFISRDPKLFAQFSAYYPNTLFLDLSNNNNNKRKRKKKMWRVEEGSPYENTLLFVTGTWSIFILHHFF